MTETSVGTEQAPEYDGPARVRVRYAASNEPGEVSLPGFLNPIPSIVEPGDTFTMQGSLTEQVTGSDRFEYVGEADPADDVPVPAGSGNDKLTKAELGEKLGLDDADVKATLHDDLVDLADQHDRLNPVPPGNPGDTDDTTGA